MAYDVYTLTGYILDVKNYSEYDKRITIFSKENGVLEAVAISSQKPASKLRPFLIRFAKVSIDVVHGKSGYRITRASSLGNGFVVHKKESYFVLSRFVKLLDVLIPYNVESIEAYNTLDELSTFLQNNLITEESSSSVFYKYALLLLSCLGYTKSPLDISSLNQNDMKTMYEYIINENGLSRVI